MKASEISEDIFSCDQADETSATVYDRSKIALAYSFEKIGHGSVCLDRRIPSGADEAMDRDIFLAPEIGAAGPDQMPEKISFGEGADIHTVLVDDRECIVSMEAHFFQRLTDTAAIVDTGSLTFGSQEFHDIIHGCS